MLKNIEIKVAGDWLKVLFINEPTSTDDDIYVLCDWQLPYFRALEQSGNKKEKAELRIDGVPDTFFVEFNGAPRMEAGRVMHCILRLWKAAG